MATLENLTPSSLVRGVTHDAVVEVVNVKWFGNSAIELTYKVPTTGLVGTRLLYRDDEVGLDVVEHGLPWSFDGDGDLFRLVFESQRIRLAHPFRPRTSGSYVDCGAVTPSDNGDVRLDADPSAPAILPGR